MKSLSVSNRTRSLGNGRVPFDGAPPFPAFHHEMDQLLENAFSGFGFTRSQRALPSVEVQEQEKEYLVSVDLPGIEMKDIELTFSEGLLTLKAERKSNNASSVYSDRWSGTFERVIRIGTDVDDSQIRATLKNGVLAVTLPKAPEHLPRRIQIE